MLACWAATGKRFNQLLPTQTEPYNSYFEYITPALSVTARARVLEVFYIPSLITQRRAWLVCLGLDLRGKALVAMRAHLRKFACAARSPRDESTPMERRLCVTYFMSYSFDTS